MDAPEFTARLEACLHPAHYRAKVIHDAAPFSLLLTHVNWVALGRYALAVLPLGAVERDRGVLASARRGVSRHMFTIPFLFQVGLYLVVTGPEAGWIDLVPSAHADQTGLHGVIIQGVHFVDPQTGVRRVDRSQWGSLQFGGTAAVTDAINSIFL